MSGRIRDTVSKSCNASWNLRELIGRTHESIVLANDGLTACQLTDDVAVFRHHTERIRRGTCEPHGIACLETQVFKRVDGTWKMAKIRYIRQGHLISRIMLPGAIARSSPSL